MPAASPGFDYRFSNNLDLVKFGASFHLQAN